MYVTASTAIWAWRKNMCKMPKGEQWSWTHWFSASSACIVGKNPKTPKMSPLADDAIKQGGIGRLGSLVYICDLHTVPGMGWWSSKLLSCTINICMPSFFPLEMSWAATTAWVTVLPTAKKEKNQIISFYTPCTLCSCNKSNLNRGCHHLGTFVLYDMCQGYTLKMQCTKQFCGLALMQ